MGIDLWIDGDQNRSGGAGFRYVVAVGDELSQGRHHRVVELWTKRYFSHTRSARTLNKTMY